MDIINSGSSGNRGYFSSAQLVSEHEIEYTAADGSQKTMSRDEAMEKLKNQDNYKIEDGRLIKEDEGKMKLDEVEEKDPDMAEFIQLGEVAHKALQRLGHAPGNITNLATSPRATEELVKEKVLLLVLTVTERDDNVSRYEAALKIDSKRHRISLSEAWVLDQELNRTTQIDVPPPKEPASRARFTFIFLGVLLSTMVLKAIRRRFSSTEKATTAEIATKQEAKKPAAPIAKTAADGKTATMPKLRKRTAMKPPKHR